MPTTKPDITIDIETPDIIDFKTCKGIQTGRTYFMQGKAAGKSMMSQALMYGLTMDGALNTMLTGKPTYTMGKKVTYVAGDIVVEDMTDIEKVLYSK